MDTRRKTVYRLSEWDELEQRLREPASAAEIARRQKLLESARRFREKTPLITGDIKDWIRAERGELAGG